jgi:hypothetical protein
VLLSADLNYKEQVSAKRLGKGEKRKKEAGG